MTFAIWATVHFFECDRVWFLAWDTGGAKYIETPLRQHEIYKANCELCANVFDALARTGKPFLFTTSQLAGLPNAYGQTKLLAENWTRQLGGKVARLWNTYGWECYGIKSHVIPDLVLSGLTCGRVKVMTNGEERRRFIYKSDCAEALIRLFDGDEPSADIAGFEWVTIRGVAEEIASQLKSTVDLGEKKGSELVIDPTQLIPGLHLTVSLSEGISKVIDEARTYLRNYDTVYANQE